MPQSWS